MEMLSYLIVSVFSFWIGWTLRTITIANRLSENPDKTIEILKQIKKLKEQSEKSTTDVTNSSDELEIERVGEQLYAYTKDNGEFIAQADNLETLLEKAHKRFPDRTFFGTISKDNPAKELVTKN
jgi:molecular chaperone GrpE (heat shock protein)